MKKKILSLLLAAIMLVFQLATVPAAARDTAAIDNALQQLKSLLEADKEVEIATIFGYIWDYVENNSSADAEAIYQYAKDQYNASTLEVTWNSIIAETSAAGRIDKGSVTLLIDKLLSRRSIITEYYETIDDIYTGYILVNSIDDAIKTALGLDPDDTNLPNAVIYILMLSKMGQIITLNTDNDFVLVENANAVENIVTNLNIDGLTLATVTLIDPDVETKVNSKLVTLLNKTNTYIDTYGFSNDNLEGILEIFDLYTEPTPEPTPTHTTNPGGPVGPGGGSEDDDDSSDDGSPATPIDHNTPQEEVKTYIETKTAAVEAAKDAAEAVEIVKTVINETKALIAAAAANTDTAAAVKESVTQLIDKVMTKVNTETVAPTVTGTAAKAVVSDADATELLNKIDTIISTANTIKESLDEAGSDIKVEKVLKIAAASTDIGVKAAEVELPSNIITAAKEKGIDKIAVDTGIATIAVSPDALTVTGTEKVTLNASVMDKEQLPEEVKAAVGDETVYDFNAFVGETRVSSFNKPLEIAVPYTLKAGEDPDKITVFYINDEGKLENVIGKYDAATGKVSFTTSHFSGYVVKHNDVTFADLTATEWARKEIESMAAKGIIQGVGNNNFAPQSTLTRAQFATMIVNAFKLQNTTVENVFTDVKDTDWFYSAVLSAYASGIIKGTTTTTFSPNAYISRQDMAVMISRALVLLANADASKDRSASIADFPDKDLISDYAVKGFEMTASYGIMIGNAQGKLNPKGNATRAEAAIVLYRLFNTVY
jgi:hypothetical protein